MASVLRHRGPDEAGYCVLHGGRVGLAHLRLKIIDLEHGQQPMFSADGTLAIAFNGEIYDFIEMRRKLMDEGFRFNTRSDTEVLLALYQRHGLDFFRHLEGEFAFVLWDGANQRLIAARDRSGVKPLFYYRDPRTDELIFASEAKAILSLERVPHAISTEYMIGPWFGAFPVAASAFQDISALPPAHVMVVDGAKIDIRPYWEHRYETRQMSLGEACEELRFLFTKAVRRRLVADVPVGTFLSGGIDSSLVCAKMAEAGYEFRAFNIGFGGSVYDESNQARRVAEHYGVPFETFDCTIDRTAEALEDTLFHIEYSMVNPCAVGKFLLSRLVRDSGYKVCLTGEGADESFAGFPYFKLEKLWRMQLEGKESDRKAASLWKRFKSIESRSEGAMWHRRSDWKKMEHPFGYPCFHRQRALDYAELLPSIMNVQALGIEPGRGPHEVYEQAYDAAAMCALDPVNAARVITWRQLYNYVIPVLGDRPEMAHAVECRTPYLDREMLEFSDRLPPEFLVDIEQLREKFILHEAFRDILPPAVLEGHKHTYLSPDWRALRQSPRGRQLIDHYLSTEQLRSKRIFNPSGIRRYYWLWRTLPYGSALRKRLDLMLGAVLSIQILSERLVVNPPRGDAAFAMVERIAAPDVVPA